MTTPITPMEVGIGIYLDVATEVSGIYMRLSEESTFAAVAAEFRQLAGRLDGHIATLERGLRSVS